MNRLTREFIQHFALGIAILMAFLMQGTAFAQIAMQSNNVVHLKVNQMRRALTPLLGTYYTTFPDERDTTGTVTIEGKNLVVAFIAESGNVRSLLTLPIDWIGQAPQTSTFKHGFEKGSVEKEVQYENSELIKTVIKESATIGLHTNSRMVEETVLRLVDGELEFRMTRNYYKRKYEITGPWIIAEDSHLQKVDGIRVNIFFGKVSDRPMSLATLSELARNAKGSLEGAKFTPEISTAEVLNLADFRKSSAPMCEDLLR